MKNKPLRASQSRQSAATTSRKGDVPEKQSQSHTEPQKLSVKSVLIEPRENEPPRVSVSVEYQSEAPTTKALKKAALAICHDVVRREGKLEDLGYRAHQTNRSLVQTFECREKGEK